MKKIISIIAIVAVLTSCSRGNDTNFDNTSISTNQGKRISPPAWLYGTWVKSSEEGYYDPNESYVFSPDNFIFSMAGTTANVKEHWIKLGGGSVEEKVSANSYTIILKGPYGMQTITYSFKRISNNKAEIVYNNFEYTKEELKKIK